MSSSTAVVVFVPRAEVNNLAIETVNMLVQTPINKIPKASFIGYLKQGSYEKDTLNEIVTALAKSKKTDDHEKIAARIQSFLADTPLKEYNVKARMNEVWAQQQTAYDGLTPEELKAYNELTPEQLAEHYF